MHTLAILLLLLAVALVAGCDKDKAKGGEGSGGGESASGGGGGAGAANSSTGGGESNDTQRAQNAVNMLQNYLMGMDPAPTDQASAAQMLKEQRGIDWPAADPWGNPYAFSNEGGKPTVSSAGPDGQAGTGDDIKPQS